MDQDFTVGGCLENRTFGDEVAAQGFGVGKIAIVRERQRALVIARHDRLRVREHRRAGSRVARVADRHVTRQPSQYALAKDVGHESHATVQACHTGPIHRDDTSRLLAAVLEAVEPQIGDARCVGNACYADDAAHSGISLPCVEELR